MAKSYTTILDLLLSCHACGHAQLFIVCIWILYIRLKQQQEEVTLFQIACSYVTCWVKGIALVMPSSFCTSECIKLSTNKGVDKGGLGGLKPPQIFWQTL